MTIYRRIKGGNTWHWCKNCPNYPKQFFDIMYIEYTKTRPATSKFCKKCQRNEKRNNCKTN